MSGYLNKKSELFLSPVFNIKENFKDDLSDIYGSQFYQIKKYFQINHSKVFRRKTLIKD